MDDRYRDGGYKPTKEKFEEYKGKSILDPEVAHKYCYDIVRKHDFYTHSVGKHFPVSRQKYFYAIHAFFLEILKSREASRQMMVCKTRLLWWSETLNDIENNKKIQEPIGIALSEVYKNTNANFDLLHRMISYQLFDLERSDMQSMNDLTNYAENTRSLTFYLFLHILGINDKNAYKAASHMGRCMGIIDVLKKMQYFLINHRSYLPSDILLKHNLFFDRIYNPRVEGLVADQFYDVVLEIAAHAKKHLEVSRTFKDKLPKHAHRALLFGVEAESYLTELEDYNFDIFDDHFRRISYIKMPYRILKASKNESY
ncbi:unnamed protein product [Moneuplotes crassus]|uniref:Phytoene synthase n=1 Tax=Euplotes crassus TaxID=5936 RepID=A0AAD1XH28_EUPCR|nr:unnamed protein product [Moneuplotes crassus]